MSSPNGRLGEYYDLLSRYGVLARLFGRDGGHSRATVHRLLRADEAGTDPADVIHKRVAANLGPEPPERVLDAGSGLGGTSFYLARHFGAACEGLTLSPTQAATASASAARLGLADRCRFRVASFDDALPAGPYGLVVAIESLAHSADPARSLANLARALAPGGRIVVVDDVREPDADSGDVAAFVAGWQAPGFRTRAQWLAAFAAAGLTVAAEEDLTGRVPVRPAALRGLLVGLNRLAALVPHAGWRKVLASHRGGLALERLYARRGASYRLFVAV
ncbi:MAG: methyltransferase domain-containing protein [Proteobacteria bacterium]|nr:methyltransferase domain-containing protein [Pseudomonadota bacterium]